MSFLRATWWGNKAQNISASICIVSRFLVSLLSLNPYSATISLSSFLLVIYLGTDVNKTENTGGTGDPSLFKYLAKINIQQTLFSKKNKISQMNQIVQLQPESRARYFVNYVQLHKSVFSRPIYSQFTRFYNNKNKFKLHRLTHMFTSIKTGNQFKLQPRNFFLLNTSSTPPSIYYTAPS